VLLKFWALSCNRTERFPAGKYRAPAEAFSVMMLERGIPLLV
jgi:hypothetical protein